MQERHVGGADERGFGAPAERGEPGGDPLHRALALPGIVDHHGALRQIRQVLAAGPHHDDGPLGRAGHDSDRPAQQRRPVPLQRRLRRAHPRGLAAGQHHTRGTRHFFMVCITRPGATVSKLAAGSPLTGGRHWPASMMKSRSRPSRIWSAVSRRSPAREACATSRRSNGSCLDQLRKVPDCLGVLGGNTQQRKALRGKPLAEVSRDGQLAEHGLDGQFPYRRRRDIYPLRGGNRLTGAGAEARVVIQQPQQRVAVKKQHRRPIR